MALHGFATASDALAAYNSAIARHAAHVDQRGQCDDAARIARESRDTARYAWGWYQAMADRRPAPRVSLDYSTDRERFGPVAVASVGNVTSGVVNPWDGSGACLNSAEFPAPAPRGTLAKSLAIVSPPARKVIPTGARTRPGDKLPVASIAHYRKYRPEPFDTVSTRARHYVRWDLI